MNQRQPGSQGQAARDAIRLTGIQLRACHGVLAHEQTTPQTFVIDVAATLDLSTASTTDDLESSVDYSQITAIVTQVVTGPPVRLIERLAGKIGDEIMGAFPRIDAVAVTVHKPHAPLNELVADVSVTVSRVRADHGPTADRCRERGV